MINLQRNILIPIMFLLAMNMPHAAAQTNPQLSLTLVGQSTEQDITPAGETTPLKLEILDVAQLDVYLLQGDAYLDPDLSGAWKLVHSEGLGSFHVGYLQSAIWTFGLTVPAKIHAVNVSDGMPQVNLLIKITYRDSGEPQNVEQGVFALGVPGATVQPRYDVIWYTLAGALMLVCIGAAYVVTKGRRRQSSGDVYSGKITDEVRGP